MKAASARAKEETEAHITELLMTVEKLFDRAAEFRADIGKVRQLFDQVQDHAAAGKVVEELDAALRCKKESDAVFRKVLADLVRRREDELRGLTAADGIDVAGARTALDKAKRGLLPKKWDEVLQHLGEIETLVDAPRRAREKEAAESRAKDDARRKEEIEVLELVDRLRSSLVRLAADGLGVAELLGQLKKVDEASIKAGVVAARTAARDVEKRTAELVEGHARAMQEHAKVAATIQALKADGRDVTEAEDLLGLARGDIQNAAFGQAVDTIHQAEAAIVELRGLSKPRPKIPILEQAEAHLAAARTAGADVAEVEKLVAQADAAARKGDRPIAETRAQAAIAALGRVRTEQDPDLSLDFELRGELRVGTWTPASLYISNIGKVAATAVAIRISGGLFAKKVEGLEILPGESRELEIQVKPTNLGDVSYRVQLTFKRKADGKDYASSLERRVYVEDRASGDAATVGHCGVCTGAIRDKSPHARCPGCARLYHDTCASSVVNCPSCRTPLRSVAV